MARRSHQDVFGELVIGFQRLVLSEDVTLGGRIGGGGYADVYEGTLLLFRPNKNLAVEKVAVKVFRVVLSREKEFAEVCICIIRFAW